MVLANDNFSSIAAAVREGRTVYDNLQKVIAWTLPTNVGEVLAIVVAVMFGLALPLTPVQILWINMVTSVALGLVLAFEPTEPGTMQRPPRRIGDSIITPFMLWRIVFVSMMFLCGTFGMYFYALSKELPIEAAHTLVVNVIVVLEIFYLFSVRYVHGTSLTLRGVLGTPPVLIGVLAITVAQLTLTYGKEFPAQLPLYLQNKNRVLLEKSSSYHQRSYRGSVCLPALFPRFRPSTSPHILFPKKDT